MKLGIFIARCFPQEIMRLFVFYNIVRIIDGPCMPSVRDQPASFNDGSGSSKLINSKRCHSWFVSTGASPVIELGICIVRCFPQEIMGLFVFYNIVRIIDGPCMPSVRDRPASFNDIWLRQQPAHKTARDATHGLCRQEPPL